MKLSIPLAGVLWCACGFLQAQTPVDLAPAQPGSAVPPVIYRSAFPAALTTQGGVETSSLDWVKANAEVGQFTRGHGDILRAEEVGTAGKSNTKEPTGHANHLGHKEHP